MQPLPRDGYTCAAKLVAILQHIMLKKNQPCQIVDVDSTQKAAWAGHPCARLHCLVVDARIFTCTGGLLSIAVCILGGGAASLGARDPACTTGPVSASMQPAQLCDTDA